jgi:predicted MFS family arabinose efflux permease
MMHAFKALGVPAFRLYMSGQAVSVIGFWMRLTAQGWLAWELTGSKATLGMVSALGLVPVVLISPWAGTLADRFDRRRLLMAVATGTATVNVITGVEVLAGWMTLPHLVVQSAAAGVFRALEMPIRQAFVSDVVGKAHLFNAIGLNAAAFNGARIVGPAIAGAILAWKGSGPCFLAVAAAAAWNVLALWRIDLARRPTRVRDGGPWRQLLEGMRYVVRHRRTRTLILLQVIGMVSTWGYMALLPAYAQEVLGLAESGYSQMLAVSGVGALLGALWVSARAGRIPATRNVVFGCVWAGMLCVVGFGLARSMWAAAPALVVAAFCQVAFMATANTMIQEAAPDDLRGRVMGLWVFSFGASLPLGQAALGYVAEHVGLHEAIVGGPLVGLALSIVVRARMPPRTAGGKDALPEPARTDEIA